MPRASTPKLWTPKRIQAMRNAIRLSQAEFAKRVGINLRTLQGWERGKPVGGLGRTLLSLTEGRVKAILSRRR